MFASKHDAFNFADVNEMDINAREACMRSTTNEFWQYFAEWGVQCSMNEDVFQSAAYMFLHALDHDTIFLPFVVAHDRLHAHVISKDGDEETNWIKRTVTLTKVCTNGILDELKKRRPALLRAVFLLISPSALKQFEKSVRHSFVCLHTYPTAQAIATTHVMSAIGDASPNWPATCYPNWEGSPGALGKNMIWKPLCKTIYRHNDRGKAVDLQRLLKDSKFSEHICLPYCLVVMAELAMNPSLDQFFCSPRIQWDLHGRIQKSVSQAIQRVSRHYTIAKDLKLKWKCAFFPTDWQLAKLVTMPRFGICELLVGFNAKVVFDKAPTVSTSGEGTETSGTMTKPKRPKTKRLHLRDGLYILGLVGPQADEMVRRIRAAFTPISASEAMPDEKQMSGAKQVADAAHQALEKGMQCLGASADSCNGSELSVVDDVGRSELLRILWSDDGHGHVAKTITGGEIIVQLEGQTAPSAAVAVAFGKGCETLPCVIALADRLRPLKQMSLSVGTPVKNGEFACVWSCLQWQTGGDGYFSFPVLREWCMFYAWKQFRCQGVNLVVGSSGWIPDQKQHVKNDVLNYFMAQTSALRTYAISHKRRQELVQYLRKNAKASDAGSKSDSKNTRMLCGRYNCIGIPSKSTGQHSKREKIVPLTPREIAQRIELVTYESDPDDDDEPLSIRTGTRAQLKSMLTRYTEFRAEQDNSDSDYDAGQGECGSRKEDAALAGTPNSASSVQSTLSKRAARKSGILIPPGVRERVAANKAMDHEANQHAVAVNFDDISGPVLYEPSEGKVHRGFKDVMNALIDIFNEEPERLKWTQLFVQSGDRCEMPWCSCPMHCDSSESLSQIVSPEVRACMRATYSHAHHYHCIQYSEYILSISLLHAAFY